MGVLGGDVSGCVCIDRGLYRRCCCLCVVVVEVEGDGGDVFPMSLVMIVWSMVWMHAR